MYMFINIIVHNHMYIWNYMYIWYNICTYFEVLGEHWRGDLGQSDDVLNDCLQQSWLLDHLQNHLEVLCHILEERRERGTRVSERVSD